METSNTSANKINNAISIKNLSKKYKDFSLNNVSFTVPTGSIVGFVGQNGAGKSTTIKALLNLIDYDANELNILGKDARLDSVSIKEELGIVFDELAIPDTLTCKAINSIMKNIYKHWNSDTFFNYMEEFKLPLKKKFKFFSRGMRMKLQIAIALSHNAKLLILDEATAGLDPLARNEILDILLEFVENEEHSILMSSHITSDLERVADYITFIDNGTILISDEKYNLIESHCIVKGSKEELLAIPEEYVIFTRKNSYGCEALVKPASTVKNAFPNLTYDNATLDDILYFYVKKSQSKGM